MQGDRRAKETLEMAVWIGCASDGEIRLLFRQRIACFSHLIPRDWVRDLTDADIAGIRNLARSVEYRGRFGQEKSRKRLWWP